MKGMDKFKEIERRLDVVREQRLARARLAMTDAGLDGPGQLHNYLVCAREGKPWKGIDNSKARLAKSLFDSASKGLNEIRERAWKRVLKENGCSYE